MTDDLVSVLEPVIRAAHLELVDVELRSGVLLVTVDKEGGVDLDALTEATRAASVALDEADPIHGRYSLEVSSPGVERTLRTPAHFARAIGETVSVKTRPQVPGDRRLVAAPWWAPTTAASRSRSATRTTGSTRNSPTRTSTGCARSSAGVPATAPGSTRKEDGDEGRRGRGSG